MVEVEQLAAVSEVLTTLGFGDFRIRINHRQLLPILLTERFHISEAHAQAQALIILDKLDKIGQDGVVKELVEKDLTTAERALEGLKATPSLPADSVLHEILRLCIGTPAEGKVVFDQFLARGLSYYTGAIMEISVPDLAGSLGGGGRYDNLVGMFMPPRTGARAVLGHHDVPACGFSLGLERIIVVMTERGMFPAHVASTSADAMVTIWNDGGRSDALALAGELRRGGLRVDVYPDADKLGKQFKYAASRNVPFVTVVGDDEKANGTVSVKDMRSGDQQTMPRADVAAYILRTRTS